MYNRLPFWMQFISNWFWRTEFPYLIKMSQCAADYFKRQHYNSTFVNVCCSIHILLFEKEVFWIIFNFFFFPEKCGLSLGDNFLDSVTLCSFPSPWNISGLHCLWTWEHASFAVPSWEHYPRKAQSLFYLMPGCLVPITLFITGKPFKSNAFDILELSQLSSVSCLYFLIMTC